MKKWLNLINLLIAKEALKCIQLLLKIRLQQKVNVVLEYRARQELIKHYEDKVELEKRDKDED